jgi:phosphomannomutase
MALMVGVSGIRGIVGETLTPQVVLEFAQAYGTFLDGGRVALGRDTRPSGEMFAAAAAAGLIAAGCAVTQLGVVMTPTIARAVCDGGYDGGVMITASHNPGTWNGLKFLDARGLAPTSEQAQAIAGIREQGRLRHQTDSFRPLASDERAGERHVRAVLDAVEVELRPIRGLRLVLDSVNGAGCRHSPTLLSELGCNVTHLNGEPTGHFAHTPEPIAENLTQLCAAMRATGAALGFAQDPDADRLAIVDEHGVYIGEEYTLALATESVLSRRPGPVAANLSTSRLVDAIAGRHGVAIIRTPVGETNVARGMLDHQCVVGGEGNGGVIDPRIVLVRDSLSAMSLVLQLMAATGKPISELVAQLPRYVMIKQKFACPRERIEAATQAVADAFPGETVNRADGTRVDFEHGWVHVRASNTEPIVRIIAEAEDAGSVTALIERARVAAGL